MIWIPLCFTAAAGALYTPWRWTHAALLAAALAIALAGGAMLAVALIPVVILAACAWTLKRTERRVRDAAWLAAMVMALSLGLHLWPGFTALTAWPPLRLSADSTVFAGHWSVDKWLAGLLLLPLFLRAGSPASWGARESVAAGAGALTIAMVLGLACLAGVVRWDPKWTSLFWLWAFGNLWTCIAEEAFFRGLLQGGLAQRLAGVRGGQVIAWIVASASFGLAHAGGGAEYVLLATVAGLGYGWIYMRTGRIELSIAAHFALNAAHFLLFSYPRLA